MLWTYLVEQTHQINENKTLAMLWCTNVNGSPFSFAYVGLHHKHIKSLAIVFWFLGPFGYDNGLEGSGACKKHVLNMSHRVLLCVRKQYLTSEHVMGSHMSSWVWWTWSPCIQANPKYFFKIFFFTTP